MFNNSYMASEYIGSCSQTVARRRVVQNNEEKTFNLVQFQLTIEITRRAHSTTAWLPLCNIREVLHMVSLWGTLHVRSIVGYPSRTINR